MKGVGGIDEGRGRVGGMDEGRGRVGGMDEGRGRMGGMDEGRMVEKKVDGFTEGRIKEH